MQVNTHVDPRTYRQEPEWQHIVLTASAEAVVYHVDAGYILCADTVANSVGCGGVVPQEQQVHQSTGFRLLRAVIGIALVFPVDSKHTCTNTIFTITGLGCVWLTKHSLAEKDTLQ